GAAKVEPQHRAADAAERLCRLIDDLRVHRAAVLRVRVREHDGGAKARRMAGAHDSVGADRARRRRLVEQRFEAPRGARGLTQRHDATRRAGADPRVGPGRKPGSAPTSFVNARTMAANSRGRVIEPRWPVSGSVTRRACGISRSYSAELSTCTTRSRCGSPVM